MPFCAATPPGRTRAWPRASPGAARLLWSGQDGMAGRGTAARVQLDRLLGAARCCATTWDGRTRPNRDIRSRPTRVRSRRPSCRGSLVGRTGGRRRSGHSTELVDAPKQTFMEASLVQTEGGADVAGRVKRWCAGALLRGCVQAANRKAVSSNSFVAERDTAYLLVRPRDNLQSTSYRQRRPGSAPSLRYSKKCRS